MNIMNSTGDSFISPSTLIIDALKKIDSSETQIALVVDENKRLIGTVTDGDVRRGILRGIPLSAPVTEIMNADPITVNINDDKEKILSIMKLTSRRQIPVVDLNRVVVRIESLKDIVQTDRFDNWVILMAGGLGKRLFPLTTECPKPMLEVGSKPILETILENFISYGFWRIFISVNHKAEKLIDYFGDGSKWGVEIHYIRERAAMGTAGALSLLNQRPDKSFFVMNGDILTKINFQQLLNFHQEHRSNATMCVREYDFHIPYGVVKADNYALTAIDEKPIQSFFINAGIYVLEPQVIDLIPKNASFDMPNLFKMALDLRLNPLVFPIREYWLDVGQMSDFERAKKEYEQIFPGRQDPAGEDSE